MLSFPTAVPSAGLGGPFGLWIHTLASLLGLMDPNPLSPTTVIFGHASPFFTIVFKTAISITVLPCHGAEYSHLIRYCLVTLITLITLIPP